MLSTCTQNITQSVYRILQNKAGLPRAKAENRSNSADPGLNSNSSTHHQPTSQEPQNDCLLSEINTTGYNFLDFT